MKWFARPCIAFLLCVGTPALPAQDAPPPASLIFAGWFGDTAPTPSFIASNLAFLETQPFDGLVVHLRDPGLTSNVTLTVMSDTSVSYAAASWVMSPLVGLPFNRLSNNLGMILAGTPPDFFDDWSLPIQNFANVARAAKDAGLSPRSFSRYRVLAFNGAGHSEPTNEVRVRTRR